MLEFNKLKSFGEKGEKQGEEGRKKRIDTLTALRV